jgi:hypothetical protein
MEALESRGALEGRGSLEGRAILFRHVHKNLDVCREIPCFWITPAVLLD